MQATAARQPTSVHELTAQLFAPYDIAGGHIHLSGCSLEDRPFLRLTFLNPPSPSGAPQIVHCFGTSDGRLLEEPLIADLELNQLTPLAGRTPRLDSGVLRQWTDVTRRQLETSQVVGERVFAGRHAGVVQVRGRKADVFDWRQVGRRASSRAGEGCWPTATSCLLPTRVP